MLPTMGPRQFTDLCSGGRLPSCSSGHEGLYQTFAVQTAAYNSNKHPSNGSLLLNLRTTLPTTSFFGERRRDKSINMCHVRTVTQNPRNGNPRSLQQWLALDHQILGQHDSPRETGRKEAHSNEPCQFGAGPEVRGSSRDFARARCRGKTCVSKDHRTPTLRTPTLRTPHPSNPHPSGPTFLHPPTSTQNTQKKPEQ